jgi:hypothetical protein
MRLSVTLWYALGCSDADQYFEPLEIELDNRRLEHWYVRALGGWVYALESDDTDIGNWLQQDCTQILGPNLALQIHAHALRDARELDALQKWGVAIIEPGEEQT